MRFMIENTHRCLRRRHFRRHHTDYGETLVVKLDRATQHLRVAIEYTLPKAIADDNSLWTTGFSSSSLKVRPVGR